MAISALGESIVMRKSGVWEMRQARNGAAGFVCLPVCVLLCLSRNI